jgi:hypothetical protein
VCAVTGSVTPSPSRGNSCLDPESRVASRDRETKGKVLSEDAAKGFLYHDTFDGLHVVGVCIPSREA